jgi:hypothetical protein
MEAIELEAILWAMLRVESEITRAEIEIETLDDGEYKKFAVMNLEKNKQHYKVFHKMLTGVEK